MKINNICCIGAGYVGGPTMAVIASKCPDINITVVDTNPERINLWNGSLDSLPIFEPGLSEIIKEVRGKNLFFSTEIDKAIVNSEMIFIAVNTPTLTEGEGAGFGANLKYIKECARRIALVSKSDKIVVEKSTVPIKTAETIKEIFESENKKYNFEILSNPEFLAEGTAVNDLLFPDRVIIGGDDSNDGKTAVNCLKDIYLNWLNEDRILTTNVWSSELSKLASNAMLAQRVSSINSLSALCEVTGANILEVSKAIGMDNRIGNKFLKPSVGFGGSCFQKDILNLVYLCRYYKLDQVAEYWHQVVKINDYQKNRFLEKIIESVNKPFDKKIVTLLGWSFKKNTNDSRESPSISVAYGLLKLGFTINVYDPKTSDRIIINDLQNFASKDDTAINNFKINCYNDPYKASDHSNCIAILTEWDEFIHYKWDKIIGNLNGEKVIIDGRYIINDLDYQNKLDF
jgi:UDPglucose 6-dehydrogenase